MDLCLWMLSDPPTGNTGLDWVDLLTERWEMCVLSPTTPCVILDWMGSLFYQLIMTMAADADGRKRSRKANALTSGTMRRLRWRTQLWALAVFSFIRCVSCGYVKSSSHDSWLLVAPQAKLLAGWWGLKSSGPSAPLVWDSQDNSLCRPSLQRSEGAPSAHLAVFVFSLMFDFVPQTLQSTLIKSPQRCSFELACGDLNQLSCVSGSIS